jgi:hypothetical protein
MARTSFSSRSSTLPVIEIREARFQPRHQLEAVQIGHPDVDNRQLRIELHGEGQCIPGRARSDDVMGSAEHTLNGAKHAGFVVHDQNP